MLPPKTTSNLKQYILNRYAASAFNRCEMQPVPLMDGSLPSAWMRMTDLSPFTSLLLYLQGVIMRVMMVQFSLRFKLCQLVLLVEMWWIPLSSLTME